MKRYVIDTSALMGIIEENKAVMDLYSRMVHGKIDLVAPEYLLVEFANAMRMGKKKPISEVLGMISRLRSSGIKFVKIASDETDSVVKESFDSDLTVYDAIYVYLARKLNLKLITEDKRILKLTEIAIKPENLL